MYEFRKAFDLNKIEKTKDKIKSLKQTLLWYSLAH